MFRSKFRSNVADPNQCFISSSLFKFAELLICFQQLVTMLNSMHLISSLVPSLNSEHPDVSTAHLGSSAFYPELALRQWKTLLDFVSIELPRHHLVLSNSGVEDFWSSLQVPFSSWTQPPINMSNFWFFYATLGTQCDKVISTHTTTPTLSARVEILICSGYCQYGR